MLVDVTDLRPCRLDVGLGQGTGELEAVDADAHIERDLVAQHMAGDADFTLIAEPCAQQARPGESPSVAKIRNVEHDEREPVNIGADGFRRLARIQAQAQRLRAGEQALALLPEARERDEHGSLSGQGLIVLDEGERTISGHKAAP